MIDTLFIPERLAELEEAPTDAELARFRSCCQPLANGCIKWTGPMMWKGYGIFHVRCRTVRAHRYSYQLSGEIPNGMVLDHLCRNRLCVNPMHLEPVTPAENLRRSPIAPATINANKTHCPQGHEYSVANTTVRSAKRGGIRECRACSRAETARYLSNPANREKRNATRRAKRAAERSAS